MIFIYFILFKQIKDPLRSRPISRGRPGSRKAAAAHAIVDKTD